MKEINTTTVQIGMLRQFLNEDRIKDAKNFVTNEDLIYWLSLPISPSEKPIEQPKEVFAGSGKKPLTETNSPLSLHSEKDVNKQGEKCECEPFNKDIIDISNCSLHQGNTSNEGSGSEFDKKRLFIMKMLCLQCKPEDYDECPRAQALDDLLASNTKEVLEKLYENTEKHRTGSNHPMWNRAITRIKGEIEKHAQSKRINLNNK